MTGRYIIRIKNEWEEDLVNFNICCSLTMKDGVDLDQILAFLS